MRRQGHEQARGKVGGKPRYDIGDDLRMLVAEIGLQAFHRQAGNLYPYRFLHQLRLHTVFENRVHFFLRQRIAQQPLKALGGFRNGCAFGE